MEGTSFLKRPCFKIGQFLRKFILHIPLAVSIIGLYAYPCVSEPENKEQGLKLFSMNRNEHVDVT